jgi:hypothetical protein
VADYVKEVQQEIELLKESEKAMSFEMSTKTKLVKKAISWNKINLKY